MKQIKHLEFSYSVWTSVARPETPTKTRSWILEILWKSVAIVYSCKLSLWITGDDMDWSNRYTKPYFREKKETEEEQNLLLRFAMGCFLRSLEFILFLIWLRFRHGLLKILKGFSNNYREAEEDGLGRKLERESWKQNKHRKIWVHGVLRRTMKEEWERFEIRVGNLGKRKWI